MKKVIQWFKCDRRNYNDYKELKRYEKENNKKIKFLMSENNENILYFRLEIPIKEYEYNLFDYKISNIEFILNKPRVYKEIKEDLEFLYKHHNKGEK